MPEFITTSGQVPYLDAVAAMEGHVAAMMAGTARDRIWFLEHPPTYTAGTSATAAGFKTQPLNESQKLIPPIPVYQTGRGGQYTYHGPGQRVVYVMLNLAHYYPTPDIRRFVVDLEEWMIRALADLGVVGERRPGRIGIWVVKQDGTEVKIAALGIRVRHGIAFHGLAINVNPDLSHYDGIIPCGINDYGVTSLADLGVRADMATLDRALTAQFYNVFTEVV